MLSLHEFGACGGLLILGASPPLPWADRRRVLTLNEIQNYVIASKIWFFKLESARLL
jgi:hypothetical protein